MTFKKLGLLLAGASAAVFMVACGETSTPDGGTAGCTSTSCPTGETCLASAKVCVKTCTAGADCPDSAKTCAPLGGGAMDGGAAFCQCATDALCNGTSGGSLVCSKLDKVCVPKCGSSTDCSSPRTCDTGTGQCQAGGTDAGSVCSPACAAGKVCSTALTCVDACFPGYCSVATDTCSLTTGFCGPAATCSSANQEPDVCAYGQYCESTNKCSDVPAIPSAAACPNFAAAGTVWDPSVDRGIIIYAIESLPGDDNVLSGTPWCGAGLTSFTGKIYAYNPTSQFPAAGSGLSGFWYVDSTGAKIDGVVGGSGGFGIFRKTAGYSVSADRKTATIKFTLCSSTAAAGSSIPAGFYFTGGNEFCTSLAD